MTQHVLCWNLLFKGNITFSWSSISRILFGSLPGCRDFQWDNADFCTMSETVTFLSLKGKETWRQEVPEDIPKAEVRGVKMVSRSCSESFERLVESYCTEKCVMLSCCWRQKCLTSDHKQVVDYFRLIFRTFSYPNVKLVLLACKM